jgi:hypothetical protein
MENEILSFEYIKEIKATCFIPTKPSWMVSILLPMQIVNFH